MQNVHTYCYSKCNNKNWTAPPTQWKKDHMCAHIHTCMHSHICTHMHTKQDQKNTTQKSQIHPRTHARTQAHTNNNNNNKSKTNHTQLHVPIYFFINTPLTLTLCSAFLKLQWGTVTVIVSLGFEWWTMISQSACAGETHHSFGQTSSDLSKFV